MSGATTVATVLCAVRGAREAEVVTTLAAPGLQVTRRCADVVELLAAAAAGAGRVAVVSCDLPALDRQAIVDLHAHGVRVVALAPGGTWEEGRLRAYGVDAVVDLDSAPDALRDVVRAVLPLREAEPGAPGAIAWAAIARAASRGRSTRATMLSRARSIDAGSR